MPIRNNNTAGKACGRRLCSPFLLFLPLVIINGLLLLYVSPVPHYPDEVAHFSYVETISRTGVVPSPTDPLTPRQRTLTLDINWGAIPVDGELGVGESVLDSAGLPENIPPSHLTQAAATYPRTYYSIGAFLSNLVAGQESLFRQFTFLRFYSFLLWIPTLWLAYMVTREVFPDNGVYSAWALALLCFHPRLATVGVSVNSDILAIFFMTLILWRCLILIKADTFRARGTALTFVLCGAAAGIKPQLILSVPFFFLALALQQLGHPEDRISRKRLALAGAGAGVIFIGGSVAASFMLRDLEGKRVWDLLNMEGGVLSLLSYIAVNFQQVFLTPYTFPREGDSANLFGTFFQYWIYLRPGLTPSHELTDSVMLFIPKVLVWAGLGGFLWKAWKKKATGEEWFVFAVSAVWWLWMVCLAWLLFAREEHLQGRYFLPVIAAAMPMLVSGFDAFPRRWLKYAAVFCVLFMMLFFEYELLKTLLLVYR